MEVRRLLSGDRVGLTHCISTDAPIVLKMLLAVEEVCIRDFDKHQNRFPFARTLHLNKLKQYLRKTC